MTETQLRFLRAIAERLPVDRVAELYLFPPMRQGTLETGIAVVAAVREVAPDLAAELAAAPDVALDVTEDEANDTSAEAIGDAALSAARDEDASSATTGASAGEACDPTDDASRDVEASDDADTQDTDARGVEVAAAADAVAGVAANVFGGVETSAAASLPPVAVAEPFGAGTPRERHTVYTARYRLALKGPERGRWEFNLVDEADAPLLTVEMVVRGVQQRSGEGAEPERLEPHALRELLGVPVG